MPCEKQNIKKKNKKRLTIEDFVEAKQDICSSLFSYNSYNWKDTLIAVSNHLKPLPSYIIKEIGKDKDIQKEAKRVIIDELTSKAKLSLQYSSRLGSAKHAMVNELTSEAAGQGKSDMSVFKLKNMLKLPDIIIEDAALEGLEFILYSINENFVGESLKLKEMVNLPDNVFQKAALRGVASNLTVYRSEGLDRVIEIKTRLNLPEDINLYLDYFLVNYPVKNIISTFDLHSISQLIGFCKNNRKFMLKVEQNRKLYLEKKDLPAIADLHISLFEAEELKSKSESTDLVALASNKDFKQLFENLKLLIEEWKETIPGTVHAMPMPQNYTWGGGPIGNSYSYDPIWVPNEGLTISSIFQEGAEVFGYENMFKYMDRKGLSRHDALFIFKNVLELYKASGLIPSEFYNNILQQVKMDNSSYNEGTAHHHLNNIVNNIVENFNLNFDQVISAAKKYTDLSCLQELLNVLSSKKEVFASWKNLKKYDELSSLLNRAEILSQFEKLKSTGKQKLYNYIEKLVFHPSINTSKVLEFWQDPEKFLGESDDDSPNNLRPSSYLEIPYIDLSAEELRDALVEGKLDSLQVFMPLEIIYKIPKENFSIQEAVKTALGSRKNNVKGKAKSPPKLFYNLNNFLKAKGISMQEYISGKKADKLLEKEVEKLVYDESFGMPQTEELQVYTAKIHPKSDPDGVVAGDDTACCMPFGSDNNTNYTFNPNTAVFTLQIQKTDSDKRRTIAQSVLTKNKDIKLHKSLDCEKRLSEQLPETMLIQEPAVLVCDNVEVAPNHTDKKNIIEKIYKDFFKEYLKVFGKKQNLATDKIIIGRGFSDALTHLPKVENTYTPQAPIIYSDNKGKESSILNLNGPDDNLNKTVKTCKAKKLKKEYLNIKSLEYLTFEDSLEASYLESTWNNKKSEKILTEITNELIAKDINNAVKNRPDMSLKYKDENNKFEGYILAYEGRLTKGQEKSIPVVFVSSIAATSQEVEEKLIQSFVQLFKQNYFNKSVNTPLYLEIRESTYHGFLQEQIIKAGKNLSIAFETENLQSYKRNKEKIHPILIKPVK